MLMYHIVNCQCEGGAMSLRDYEMVMKSVADPTRVRILKLLEAGEMCGCQIVAILELSQSPVSQHLFPLKLARELGPANICERGMTLPSRRAAACCPAPRKEAVGSK